ncbi:MAG: hypothetical protein RIA69_17750 [Cyclobacteriaceae bacterium]
MGLFGKSVTREVGKNTGKWISNKVFGDGHSTPYRVKVNRQVSNRSSNSSRRSKKTSPQSSRSSYNKTAIEIAEINARANDSDKVKLKRIENQERAKKREQKFSIIAGIVLFLGYGIFFGIDYLHDMLTCKGVDDCLAQNDFESARGYLENIHPKTQSDDAIKIVNAELTYYLSKSEYRNAYESATLINGIFFEYGDEGNILKQEYYFGRFIERIVKEAILNDDLEEARKYKILHPDPDVLNPFFKEI